MLQLLDIPPLSTRRKYLKLTTMYNIVANQSYFPPNIFVGHDFPYSTHRRGPYSTYVFILCTKCNYGLEHLT